MTQRKSRQVKDEISTINTRIQELEVSAKELQDNAKELNDAVIKAEEEELKLLETINGQISKIAEKNGVFCGVILTYEDILNILSIAIKSGENIKIGYNIYFNDNTE